MIRGIITWIKCSFCAMFSLTGVLVSSGVLFAQIEQLNNRYLIQAFGRWGILLTGSIGTVVHEASHYVMCFIFGHRVVEVAWFRPFASVQDGVLGYVNHTYRQGNLYQVIGNLFIGIAPLIGGTSILILIFRFLMSESYQEIKDRLIQRSYPEMDGAFLNKSGLQLRWLDFIFIIKSVFNLKRLSQWKTWIFLFLAYSITTHMFPSSIDLEHAFSGFLILFACICVTCLIAIWFGKPNWYRARWVKQYNLYLISFIGVGLSFLMLSLTISKVASLIFS